MPETVWIVRHVIFAVDAGADHPAIAAAREGRPVEPSLLPAELLGRDPSAVTGSVWFIEAGGETVQIFLSEG
jgi:hypothetical protein